MNSIILRKFCVPTLLLAVITVFVFGCANNPYDSNQIRKNSRVQEFAWVDLDLLSKINYAPTGKEAELKTQYATNATNNGKGKYADIEYSIVNRRVSRFCRGL